MLGSSTVVYLLLLHGVVSQYVSGNPGLPTSEAGLSYPGDNQGGARYTTSANPNTGNKEYPSSLSQLPNPVTYNPSTDSPTMQQSTQTTYGHRKPLYTETTQQPSPYLKSSTLSTEHVSNSEKDSSNYSASPSHKHAYPKTQPQSQSTIQPTYFRPRSFNEYLTLHQGLFSYSNSVGTTTSSYHKQLDSQSLLTVSPTYSQSPSSSQPSHSRSRTHHKSRVYSQPSHPQTTPYPQSESYPQTTPYPQSESYPQTTPHPQSESYLQTTPHPQSESYLQTTPHPQSESYPQTTPYPQSESHSQTIPYPQSESYPQATYPQSESHPQATYPQSESYPQPTYPQSTPDSQPPYPEPPAYSPPTHYKSSTYIDTPQPPAYSQSSNPEAQHSQHTLSQPDSGPAHLSSNSHPSQAYPDSAYQDSPHTYRQARNPSPYYPNSNKPTRSLYNPVKHASAYPESRPVPLPYYYRAPITSYATSKSYANKPVVSGPSGSYDAPSYGITQTYANKPVVSGPSGSYDAPSYGITQTYANKPVVSGPSGSYDAPSYGITQTYANKPVVSGPSGSYDAPSYGITQTYANKPVVSGPSGSYDAPSYGITQTYANKPVVSGPSGSYDAPSYSVTQTYANKPVVSGPSGSYDAPSYGVTQTYAGSGDSPPRPEYCGSSYNKNISAPRSRDPTAFYFRSTQDGFLLKMYGEVSTHQQSITVFSQDQPALSGLGYEESRLLVDFSHSTPIFIIKIAKARFVGCFISELKCETDFPYLADVVNRFIESDIVDLPYTTRLSYKVDAKLDPASYKTRTNVVDFCEGSYIWYNISPGKDKHAYTVITVINLFGITDVYIGEI